MPHINDPARRKTALITGASSGIGAAFAEVFASEGFDLVVTARRESRLHDIADRLHRQYGAHVVVIVADLTRADAAARLFGTIHERGVTVDALVNSAGFGAPGGYMSAPLTGHQDMLKVMVAAMSELTYLSLQGMLDRGYGRIVNVASTAGLAPTGAGTMYGAAKAFVVTFSVSLGREVSRRGVYVTAVCPGLTRTEFHERPELFATVKNMPHWMWMDPLDVARRGFRASMSGTSVCVTGGVNRLMVALLRYAPLTLLRNVARFALGPRRTSAP